MPPRRIDVVRPSCLGNGWTPNELAGDRDGGGARPRVAVTRARNVTRLVLVNVTVSPSPGGTPSVTATGSPTVTASTTAAATALLTAGAAPSVSSPATTTPSGSPPAGVVSSPSGTPTPAAGAGSGTPTTTPTPTKPAALPDAVGAPMLASPDGAFGASWFAVPSTTTDTGTVTEEGFLIQLAASGSARGGWVGIGFNPGGRDMAGSDLVAVWVRPRAAGATACRGIAATDPGACDAFVGEYSAADNSRPTLDTARGGSSDTFAYAAEVSSTHATVTLFRRLRASDTASGADADLSPGRSHWVLWAHGMTPGDTATGAFSLHMGRAPPAPP